MKNVNELCGGSPWRRVAVAAVVLLIPARAAISPRRSWRKSINCDMSQYKAVTG